MLAIGKIWDGPIHLKIFLWTWTNYVPKIMLLSSKAQFMHISAGLTGTKSVVDLHYCDKVSWLLTSHLVISVWMFLATIWLAEKGGWTYGMHQCWCCHGDKLYTHLKYEFYDVFLSSITCKKLSRIRPSHMKTAGELWITLLRYTRRVMKKAAGKYGEKCLV